MKTTEYAMKYAKTVQHYAAKIVDVYEAGSQKEEIFHTAQGYICTHPPLSAKTILTHCVTAPVFDADPSLVDIAKSAAEDAFLMDVMQELEELGES